MELRSRPGSSSALAKAVTAINEASLDGDRWVPALERVSDFVGGIGGMLVRQDFSSGTHWMKTARLDTDLARLYIQRHTRNPFALAAPKLAPGIYVAGQIADMAAVQRSAMGADILQPQRISEMVMLTHGALVSANGSGGVLVCLDARQREASGLAVDRLSCLRGHIANALDLYLTVESRVRFVASRKRMLEGFPDAVLLLSRNFDVIDLNSAAEDLLRARLGLALLGTVTTRLKIGLPRDDDMLQRAFVAASPKVPGVVGTSSVLRTTRTSGDGVLIVSVHPLLAGAHPGFEIDAAEAAILVRVIDTAGDRQARVAMFAGLFGLTPAEERVLQHLGVAQSVPEAARTMNLGVNTVRTHLTHIFDKAAVRSQVELARLIDSMPKSDCSPIN